MHNASFLEIPAAFLEVFMPDYMFAQWDNQAYAGIIVNDHLEARMRVAADRRVTIGDLMRRIPNLGGMPGLEDLGCIDIYVDKVLREGYLLRDEGLSLRLRLCYRGAMIDSFRVIGATVGGDLADSALYYFLDKMDLPTRASVNEQIRLIGFTPEVVYVQMAKTSAEREILWSYITQRLSELGYVAIGYDLKRSNVVDLIPLGYLREDRVNALGRRRMVESWARTSMDDTARRRGAPDDLEKAFRMINPGLSLADMSLLFQPPGERRAEVECSLDMGALYGTGPYSYASSPGGIWAEGLIRQAVDGNGTPRRNVYFLYGSA